MSALHRIPMSNGPRCYTTAKFLLPLLLVCWAAAAAASESTSPFALWDGHESVAEYAKRVNLPPTRTLDVSDSVKIELVLIPAGKFMMGTGTPEPALVDEEWFCEKIVTAQVILGVSIAALLIMVLIVAIRAIQKKRRPQWSLRLLLMVTLAAGGILLSVQHWQQSSKDWMDAREAYWTAKKCYKAEQAEFREARDSEGAAFTGAKPAHPVTLTKPFYMGKFVVTQRQYQAVTGARVSEFKPNAHNRNHAVWGSAELNPSDFKGKDNPVEAVSWNDVELFCMKLSTLTHQTVRLPTEAEWEYSCRAGATTAYYSGDTEADLARVAWYGENSGKTTHPVGQKEPNAFGLYDMHGNVSQWCQDWGYAYYIRKLETENPQGPAQGTERILRGGSWHDTPNTCQSFYRERYRPDSLNDDCGFRVVVEPALRTP